MSISWQGKRLRRLARNAMLLSVAMLLSYLEFLLPLQPIFPIPGVRLGLANLVVTVAFFCFSPLDAALVSATRIGLSALLFGSVTSFYFSAMGGIFSFLTLALISKVAKRCSFFGLSVLCAAAHNTGQIVAAMTLFGPYLLRSYLPVLLIAAVFCGGGVGLLLNACMPRLQKSFKEDFV